MKKDIKNVSFILLYLLWLSRRIKHENLPILYISTSDIIDFYYNLSNRFEFNIKHNKNFVCSTLINTISLSWYNYLFPSNFFFWSGILTRLILYLFMMNECLYQYFQLIISRKSCDFTSWHINTFYKNKLSFCVFIIGWNPIWRPLVGLNNLK